VIYVIDAKTSMWPRPMELGKNHVSAHVTHLQTVSIYLLLFLPVAAMGAQL